ncbi:MAG: hypothetical protein MMC33_004543 [Icmadophila ericetorum]|nr:hypothetical protein [Icmadophila ericetorum]
MKDYSVPPEEPSSPASHDSFKQPPSRHSFASSLPGKLLTSILNLLSHTSAAAVKFFLQSSIPYLGLIIVKFVDVFCFVILYHLKSARRQWEQLSNRHELPKSRRQRLYGLLIRIINSAIDICIPTVFTGRPTLVLNPPSAGSIEPPIVRLKASSQHVIYPPSPLSRLCPEELGHVTFKESTLEEGENGELAAKEHGVLEEDKDVFRFGGIFSRIEAYDKVKEDLVMRQQPSIDILPLLNSQSTSSRSVSSNTTSTDESLEQWINPRTEEEDCITRVRTTSNPSPPFPIPPRRSSTPALGIMDSAPPANSESSASHPPPKRERSLSMDGLVSSHTPWRRSCIACAGREHDKKSIHSPSSVIQRHKEE